MVRKIMAALGCLIIGTALAIGLLMTLFHASVQYTFRNNPPTAEELAEDPTLIQYLP